MKVISRYTRKEALDDAVLVDVTKMADEAGISCPVALTRAVFERYVAVPESAPWQDETGRLWDVLWMLRHAVLTETGSERLFKVYVQTNDHRAPRLVTLKAVCGPGDNGEPVITVMLPEEE